MKNIFGFLVSLFAISSIDLVTAAGLSDLSWRISGDVVTITDCDEEAAGDLAIPTTIERRPVTRIGNDAFRNCINLRGITIPDSVSTIGERAFQGCAISSITIPDSVTSIGNHAFSECESLTSIAIPDSVTNIENGTFRDCKSLRSVAIPDSVSTIGNYAFSGCTTLTGLALPNGITSIADQAFRDCLGLRALTIPASVERLGSYAFRDCSGLTVITFRGDKPSFGQGVLSGVNGMVIYPSFASGFSNPFAGLRAYKDGDYDPVNHHNQQAAVKLLREIRDNGRDDAQNTQLEILKQIRDELKTLNTKMLDLQAVVAERDAQIAQLEKRPTIEELQEGRDGSIVLQVNSEERTVTIGLTIEQSEDLLEWVPVEGELTRTIPVPDGKKFFRFAMDRGEREGQG